MDELWKLALWRLKGTKKNSLLLTGILFLSFTFTVISLSITDSMEETNRQYLLQVYGSFKAAVYNGTEAEKDLIASCPSAEKTGVLRSFGSLQGQSAIGTASEELLATGDLQLLDGHFPEKSGEIVMEAGLLSTLGYDYGLNQTIHLSIQTGEETVVEKDYLLCGVLKQYSNLWAHDDTVLPGALITEESASDLNASPLYHYFVTSEEEPDILTHELAELVNNASNAELKLIKNTLAYPAKEETGAHFFYVLLLLLTTVIAVGCVYLIQLQEQVRSIALFRSIGGTRKQLAALLFYETLSMVLPCILLGIPAGAVTLQLLFHFLADTGTTNFYLSIPLPLLAFVTALWLLSILLCRMVILLLALRQPLTGRISLPMRKRRRYVRRQHMLLALLSGMFAAVVLFMLLQGKPQLYEKQYWEKENSYLLSRKENLITSLDLRLLQDIPGIKKVISRADLTGELTFPEMEQVPLAAACMENSSQNQPYLLSRLGSDSDVENIPFPEGIGVKIIGIREEYWEDYFDTAAPGFSPEKFQSGEQALVAFATEEDNKIRINGQVYTDTGLQQGDKITLSFYSAARCLQNQWEDLEEPENIGSYSLELAADVLKVNQHSPYAYSGSPDTGYNILVSDGFIRKVLSETQGYKLEHYTTGEDYGETSVEIYAFPNAGYLSTDYLLADFAESRGLQLENRREELSAVAQNHTQKLLLIFVCGSCICLTLLLLLWNMLTLSAKAKSRQYGILQALGMSGKQMKHRLLRQGALLCISSLAFSGIVCLLYTVLEKYLTQTRLFQEYGEKTALSQLLLSEYHYLKLTGIDASLLLLYCLFVSAVLLLLFYCCSRFLIKSAPLEKLRS